MTDLAELSGSTGDGPRRGPPGPASRRVGLPASLLGRIFVLNAAVFVTAGAALAFSPATIHASIRLSEAIVLVAGLAIMLIADFALLRHTLQPLQRLAAGMADVDPMRPGQRSSIPPGASNEVIVLARSLDAMLDRLETERRESAQRALSAQEAERVRVARELHDEIGQTLTAVALQAERVAGQGDPSTSLFAEMASMIQVSIEDLRRVSRELRPEALDDLGLVNALIALCGRAARPGHPQITRTFKPTLPPLTPEVELVIYRVAQEALTNALRHSGASVVNVSLRQHGAAVVLAVSDDGRTQTGPRGDGAGITGMRERAMLIGANLEIEPDPCAGTTVVLTVPGTA